METKIKKRTINFYELPTKKYRFRATVEALFNGYKCDETKATPAVHFDNIEVFMNGIWAKVEMSRKIATSRNGKSWKNVELKCGDIIEFNAEIVYDYHQFNMIQLENGSCLEVPFCKESSILPLDYKGDITIKIYESMHFNQNNKTRERIYTIILDRETFNKEIGMIIMPYFSYGYCRHVHNMCFTDKRFNILGKVKNLSSNEN